MWSRFLAHKADTLQHRIDNRMDAATPLITTSGERRIESVAIQTIGTCSSYPVEAAVAKRSFRRPPSACDRGHGPPRR